MSKIENGTRFGKLKVLNFYKRINYRPHYVCICDCEKLVTVREDHLLSNHTRSCGCLRSENARKQQSKSKLIVV